MPIAGEASTSKSRTGCMSLVIAAVLGGAVGSRTAEGDGVKVLRGFI